jgi:hypothetical protein
MDHAANDRTGSEVTDYVKPRRSTEHQAPGFRFTDWVMSLWDTRAA